MRHHHGDGDHPLPVAPDGEGVPFNVYTARMLEDIDGVRWLCDTLEHVAGELPNGDTSVRLLGSRLAAARRFMDALAIMPTMIATATPEDAQRAAQSAAREAR